MRTLGVIALAAVSLVGGMLAQQPDKGKNGMMGGNMQMMAMHEQMMADMKAMDATIDQKLAAMNAAKGDKEKMDAMAAVINEMVAGRKQMMTKMSNMQGQMMKGMMGGNSPDNHVDHPADHPK